MKKLIFAPIPEQQIIYIDGEIAVINNDKVIYLQINDIADMSFLYTILAEWNIGDHHKSDIINYILDIYDSDRIETPERKINTEKAIL